MAALTDREIIEKIGAETLIAEGPFTAWQVDKWVQKDRGIPWKDRAKVAAIAGKKRVRLPADFLQERRPA